MSPITRAGRKSPDTEMERRSSFVDTGRKSPNTKMKRKNLTVTTKMQESGYGHEEGMSLKIRKRNARVLLRKRGSEEPHPMKNLPRI